MRVPSQQMAELSDAEQGQLAQRMMRRQAALSLRVAAVFVLLLFGLPLVNHFQPEQANAPVFGIPATWLFLGVLFYPITVLLSVYFVRHSDRIEAECAQWTVGPQAKADGMHRDVAVVSAIDRESRG